MCTNKAYNCHTKDNYYHPINHHWVFPRSPLYGWVDWSNVNKSFLLKETTTLRWPGWELMMLNLSISGPMH